MKKYDIFLFDADNTLFDYDKAEGHALETMFTRSGFTYAEEIRARYREINNEAWTAYEKGEISIAEFPALRFSRLLDEIGETHDPADFNENYLAELGKGAFLIDGAEEICREITQNGKQIFIVTNGLLATQKSRIAHSLIKDYISGYFVSSSVGHQKPEIKFFEHVFANIPKIPKEKILIIGDSLSADIAGGNNAGISTAWFNEHRAENPTGITPTYEIHKLSELRKFI